MSALREILATFDIIVNSEQLEAGTKKLDTFVDKLKAVGTALAGFAIVKSIVSFGEHVTEAARAVEFHAGRMEMDTNEYQKLSQVAANYGVTMEQLQIANTLFVRGLSGMGGTMGTFSARTNQAQEAMRNLHLDAKQFRGQRLEQILPVISDAMLKVTDPMERVAIGLRLFGHRGRAIMPLMAVGGDELRRQLAAAIPVFEEATIKSADKSAVAVKQLGRSWDNLIYNSFGRALMDTMTVVAHKLTDVVTVLKDLIKTSDIGKATLLVLSAVLAAAAVVVIAAWWPVLLPILAIVAAFTALVLIVDDFIGFMEGKHSVIGRFFNELLGEGGADKARDKIKELWEDVKGFFAAVGAEQKSEFFRTLKEDLQGIAQLLHDIKRLYDDVRLLFEPGRVGHAMTPEEFERNYKAGGLSSPFAGAANIPAPALIAADPDIRNDIDHRPSEADAKKGITFNMIGTIDPHRLAEDLARVAEHTMNTHQERALRDTMAGAGGSK